MSAFVVISTSFFLRVSTESETEMVIVANPLLHGSCFCVTAAARITMA